MNPFNHGTVLLMCVSCSVVSDSLWLPWTEACQVPLSMKFSRQEYWSGLLFPSPGDLPDPGIEPRCPASQAHSWWLPPFSFDACYTTMVKNLPGMKETWVQSLGQEDFLEKGMTTHSRILAWRISWTEEPHGCSPWGHKESDMTEQLTQVA